MNRSSAKPAVLAVITARPGLPLREVAEAVGITTGYARELAARLVQEGALARVGSAFVAPEAVPAEVEPQRLAPVERRAEIVRIYQSEVTPSQRELARRFDCNLKTLQNDLRILEAAGALARDPGGRHHRGLVATGRPYTDPGQHRALSNRVN